MSMRLGDWLARLLIGAGLIVALVPIPGQAQVAEEALYFADSGHHLDDSYGFLSFWRSNGAEQVLGIPVTEVLVEAGLTVQYFANVRLEYHAERAETPVVVGAAGRDYAAALWLRFDGPPPRRNQAGERFFEGSGHTLSQPFLSYWQTINGAMLAGAPISEQLWEQLGNAQRLVQYFEHLRLEYDPLSRHVQVSDLGRQLALLRGHALAPVPNRGLAVYTSADLPAAACLGLACPLTPTPTQNTPPVATVTAAPVQATPVATAPRGDRAIVVDLSDQWLYAYERGQLVFDAPVSTGKDGFNTPVGDFAVYARLRSQTMSGNLGGESYYVPDVPHVMYIYGGVALHGTYWHNQFGTGVRRSHGCINLPLDAAAYLYGWSSVGTPVSVRR